MRWILILVTLAACIAGCEYNRCADCEAIAEAAAPEEKELSSEKLAEIAKARQQIVSEIREKLKLTPLFEKWHHRLTAENIARLHLSGGVLFAETEAHKLYAFSHGDGVPLWVYTLAGPLDFPPEVHGDRVFLSSRAMLHILNKNLGEPLAKRDLGFVPSSPFRATDIYLYVGGWDRFLYALDPETGTVEWRHRVDGHIHGRPAELDGTVFVSATDSRVYAVNARSGSRQELPSYRQEATSMWGGEGYFATRASNTVQVLARENPPLVYAGSRDYNFYCLNRIHGNLRWKFECSGEIGVDPALLGSSAYVSAKHESAGESTLYCIDAETGNLKGSVPSGESVFFQGSKHVWILREDDKVATLDEKGQVRHIFDLGFFDSFAVNPNAGDTSGYAAMRDGVIFALEER